MIKIRLVKKSDLKEIININKKDKEEHADVNLIKKRILEMFTNSFYKPTYLVAEEKGEIRGHVGYAQSRLNYRGYEIFFLFVDPDYRNKGIGIKLMNKAIKQIKLLRRKKEDDYLIILSSTKPKYYSKKLGFKTLTKFNVNNSHVMALRI